MGKDCSEKNVGEDGWHQSGVGPARLSDLAKEGYEVSDADLTLRKVNEILQTLYLPSELSEEEKRIRVTRALELFDGISPQTGIEEMLALQMVATHSAAMECLRRAMIPGQFLQPQEKYIGSAQKLLTLYTRQLDALNKQRGKAAQKVTVEYVDRVKPARPATVSGKAKGARAERRWEPKVIAGEEADETASTGQIKQTSELARDTDGPAKAASRRRAKRA